MAAGLLVRLATTARFGSAGHRVLNWGRGWSISGSVFRFGLPAVTQKHGSIHSIVAAPAVSPAARWPHGLRPGMALGLCSFYGLVQGVLAKLVGL